MAKTEFHKTHLAFFRELNELFHHRLDPIVQAFDESDVGNTFEDALALEKVVSALCAEYPSLARYSATRKLCRVWLQEITLSQIALSHSPKLGA